MAITNSILLGQVISMPQNVVFALPVPKATMFCSTAGPTFAQSNDPAFGDSSTVTLTAGVSDVVAGFIRNTNAATAIAIFRAAR